MGTLIHFPVRPAPDRAASSSDAAPDGRAASVPDRAVHVPGAVLPAGVGEPAHSAGRALLWREAVGHELRVERTGQSRTLADVARRAGVSTQYLSEIERGRKEPSSEVLGAVGTALSLTLLDLTTRVSAALAQSQTSGPHLMAA